MAAPAYITVKALDVVRSALLEIGAYAQAEVPSAEDAAWTLEKMQRLMDRYNARRPMIYNVNFSRFTLKANHSPHTIGPAADFDISLRPVRLIAASLVLTSSSPNVEIPLDVKDDDWWAVQTVKGLQSTLPTAVYYSPDWPIGNLYFWPVPSAVNDVRLEMWSPLSLPATLQSTFSMPPAYWDAVIYPLAVSLCPSFGKEPSATLQNLAAQAIKAVEVNNSAAPRLMNDAPSGSGGARPDFNFLTGLRTR